MAAANKEMKLVYLVSVLNATIIGFSFLFTKVALDYAHPIDTLAYRFLVAFVVLSVPVALRLIKLDFGGKSVWKPLMLAIFYPIGFFAFQSYGLQYATSAEAGMLFAFVPVLTTLLASVFLKETTTLAQKLSIVLSVSGVVFIVLAQGNAVDLSNVAGIVLLMLSCLATSAYAVMVRWMLRDYGSREVTFLLMGIGCVAFAAISVIGHVLDGTVHELVAPLRSGPFIWSILYLGVLSSTVASLTFTYMLARLEASRTSIFSNLATVVSMVAGAIFLGEKIAAYHLIGSALIIVGVMGTAGLGRKQPPAGRSSSLPSRL